MGFNFLNGRISVCRLRIHNRSSRLNFQKRHSADKNKIFCLKCTSEERRSCTTEYFTLKDSKQSSLGTVALGSVQIICALFCRIPNQLRRSHAASCPLFEFEVLCISRQIEREDSD